MRVVQLRGDGVQAFDIQALLFIVNPDVDIGCGVRRSGRPGAAQHDALYKWACLQRIRELQDDLFHHLYDTSPGPILYHRITERTDHFNQENKKGCAAQPPDC